MALNIKALETKFADSPQVFSAIAPYVATRNADRARERYERVNKIVSKLPNIWESYQRKNLNTGRPKLDAFSIREKAADNMNLKYQIALELQIGLDRLFA